MKRLIQITIAALTILWGTIPAAHASDLTPEDILITSEAAHQKIPVLSSLFPALDAAKAMAIQKRYVARRLGHDRIAGFKAGLTSAKAQQRFGLSGPAAGVLFWSGALENSAVVDASAFHSPVIETEIGFILGKTVTEKIKGLDALKGAVREVLPVIELPDLGFADMKGLRGVDIIAANVSARQFIRGTPVPAERTDLNAVEVTLYRDGGAVNKGKGQEALGDQWQALLWLANTMIGQGYVLEPGQLFITGALGKMVPGKAGKYRADYGDFGAITFDIR